MSNSIKYKEGSEARVVWPPGNPNLNLSQTSSMEAYKFLKTLTILTK